MSSNENLDAQQKLVNEVYLHINFNDKPWMTYLIYLLRNWERSNGKCCPGSRKIDLLINSGCNQRRIAKFPEPLPNIQIGSEKKKCSRGMWVSQHKKLRIWSHLLKKSLMENFVFWAVYYCVVFYKIHTMIVLGVFLDFWKNYFSEIHGIVLF